MYTCKIKWFTADVSVTALSVIIMMSEPAHAQVQTSSLNEETTGEIVVTAQKREERLRDVPISIAVVGGKALDASTDTGVKEALNRIPGVVANVTGGFGTQMIVRGVTAAGPVFFGSSPIAYYLDSVPFGLVKTAIAPDADAFDLNRIEVLRGPQGTLYGASALNGVARIITNDADLNEFDIKARANVSSTYGGNEGYRSDVAVNVPLIPGKLAVRAVLGYQKAPGWIEFPNRRNVNDNRIKNGRLRINAQPTENLSIGLSGWLSRTRYGASPNANDNMFHNSLADESGRTKFDTANLKIAYDFSDFTISSMTSHLKYNTNGKVLSGASILTTALDAKIFTQEVVLTSTAKGPWKWSLGGIYRDGQDKLFQNRPAPFYRAPTRQTNLSESYAIFGEVTHSFLDGLFDLTGGLRYFEDKVSGREFSRLTGVPDSQLVSSDSKFDKISPRVVATLHPSSTVTAYASYAEGFRSGFDQNPAILAVVPTAPAVNADNLTNYEVGVKADLLDNRLSVEAAVYYINWQDVQQSLTFNVAPAGSPPINLFALVNGSAAKGMGFDVAVTARPIERMNVSLSFSQNDLTSAANVISNNIVLIPKGDRLNNSPKHTATVAADYSFPLDKNGMQARLSASVNYTSAQLTRSLFGTTIIKGVSDKLLVARGVFSVETPDHWTVSLFADNIFNEKGAAVEAAQLTRDSDIRIRPRTIGLQVAYRLR